MTPSYGHHFRILLLLAIERSCGWCALDGVRLVVKHLRMLETPYIATFIKSQLHFCLLYVPSASQNNLCDLPFCFHLKSIYSVP
jgi:hypothetical protein